MTAQWCANVLRMVPPHMWLCDTLVRQLDLAALRKVAAVAAMNGSFKIEKLAGCAMEDFDLALLPIESARITAKASCSRPPPAARARPADSAAASCRPTSQRSANDGSRNDTMRSSRRPNGHGTTVSRVVELRHVREHR
jgi:hypothetical protein